MGFEFSGKANELRSRLTRFMDAHIYPRENVYWEQIEAAEAMDKACNKAARKEIAGGAPFRCRTCCITAKRRA